MFWRTNAFASGKGYLGDNLFTGHSTCFCQHRRFDLSFTFLSPPFGFTGIITHLIAPARENIKDGDVPCDTFGPGYLLYFAVYRTERES